MNQIEMISLEKLKPSTPSYHKFILKYGLQFIENISNKKLRKFIQKNNSANGKNPKFKR